jgi:hypothetical protein
MEQKRKFIQIRLILLIVISVFLCLAGSLLVFSQVYPQDTSTSNASLSIVSENQQTVSLDFSISPFEIYQGDNISFTLNQALFNNGNPASGLLCRIVITAPSNDIFIFQGITSSQGRCEYSSASSPVNQGLTTQNTNLQRINSIPGNGSGYATITFSGNVYTSNTDTYRVLPTRLQMGPLTISPENINPGDQLVFIVDPISFQNGQVAANIPMRLIINTPNGTQVIIQVVTDSQGIIVFDTSQSLASQGYSLVSGNLSDINSPIGVGVGQVVAEYEGQTYSTNQDNYRVQSPLIPFPIPVDPIIPIIIRTGGAILPYGIGFGIFLIIIGFLKVSLADENRKNNKGS